MEVKPGYKQTEVGIIPEEWQILPLAQLAHIKTGKRNNEEKVADGEYPFFVRSEVVERINSYSYEGEAILVPGEGRIGDIFHYVNGRFDVHQRVYAITRFRADCQAQYLHRYMAQRFGAWAMQNTVKATVDSLRLPTFQHFLVPLPPPPEQRAIAAALSDVDALLGGLDRLIAKKRDLKQAAMQQLLTGQTRLPGFSGAWEVKPLTEIVSTPITDGPHLTPTFLNDGIPFLSVNNLVNNKLDLSSLRFVSRSDHEEFSKKCRPRRGDILFGKAASVGQVALLDTDLELNIWSPLALIRVGHKASAQFVVYALQTRDVHRQIALLTNASSQGNIGMSDIGRIAIPVPSLVEQAAISAVLSDMDAELAALEARRDKTRDLKQAMMQELLTGKTRLL